MGGKLMGVGVCCSCLSVWGILQLTLMGVFYKIETAILIEDVHAHEGEYNGYKEFVTKTRANYRKTAINCWIAAGGYGISLVLSLLCIQKSKADAKKAALLSSDDEYICQPKITTVPDTKTGDKKSDKKKKAKSNIK